MNESLTDAKKKAEIAEMYENLTNEDLVMVAMNALSEIEKRYSLCDYLTEMTYNSNEDRYDYIYSESSFEANISDFIKYLKTTQYKAAENRKKKD